MQKEDIINRIDRLPKEFKPIKDIALARINTLCRIDENGTIEIEKHQGPFPEAYNLRLFAAASIKAIEKFHDIYTIQIPAMYQQFLLHLNGIYFKELALYGLPVSLYTKPLRLLDRKIVQPLDLGAANQNWRLEYIATDSEDFYFGSFMQADYNVGYFFTRQGTIQKTLPKLLKGKTKKQLSKKSEIQEYLCMSGEVIEEWADFTSFLSSEINLLEKR